ncbi:N-acetyltransferase [Methanosarcina sp.]|uniref:GNAT family N-acetyltransferase n=1 Tax=Methanosarcina sp. TaxID=2213 RepID=UPI0029882FC0|nr:N-acetyltransferase [Methanosarcina sp.]MDW5552249.1 N-acetyltransferase [Methanosarcina sp.]MDW5556000.1 N-acetyltransferase [Methanosarcina sp.]MDW5561523.1 N-acetyltransferase [Methanosarcina sp.]
MDFTIRNEKVEDFNQVENLTREAFWNLYVPGCNEHYLVHIMRNHPDFIKKLDFVAEYNGEIIGNIMYTKAWLYSEDEIKIEIASFGPISVLPKYQRKGVGSALIRQTINIAKNDGIGVIVIFGDPHNYCKHGFKSSKDFNISDMNGEYPYGMLALELKEGTVRGHNWKYKYSPVLEINEADAEKYDKKFEHKEKEYTPSQEIFSIAVRSYLK